MRAGFARGWRLAKAALGEVQHKRAVHRAALALFAVDGALVLLHVGHLLTKALAWDAPFLASKRAAMSYEWSYAEFFEHGKTAVAVALLCVLALRERSVAFAIASAVFVLVLVDNAFGLHELAGAALEWRMGDTAFHPFGLDVRVEMLAEAAVALFIFAGIGLAILVARGQHRTAMIVLFAILLAFAAILAAAEIVNAWAWATAEWLGQLLMLIEDGLQLVLFTVVLLFALALIVRPDLLSAGGERAALPDRERGPAAAG